MKKIFGVIILVVFCMFINVKAVNITVDSNTKGTVDTNSYLITSRGSVDVDPTNIGNDTFSLYKILDAFYNSTSNVITYEFTSNFKKFLTSNSTYKNLTVGDYFNLTSGDITSGSTVTNSTLDKLMSAYTTYIKTNSIVSDEYLDIVTPVYSGAYLILPNATAKIYSVMVANVVFEPNNIGEWFLSNAFIVPKVAEPSITKSIGAIGDIERDYYLVDDISYYLVATVPRYPTNATNTVYTIKDTLGSGLTFAGVNNISIRDGSVTLTNTNGIFKDSSDNTVGSASITGNNLVITFYTNYITNSTITVEYKANFNTGAVLGELGNLNSATLTYSNDPYYTGTTTTTAVSVGAYTYGIELLVYDRDNMATLLSGVTFDVYSDSGLTRKVGTITTGSDGVGTLRGVAAGTYYLKNTKTATGYGLATTVSMSVKINGSVDGTIDGYYKVKIPTIKVATLPFTGGLGTIIYTLVGLVVIITSFMIFSLYRGKNKNKRLS